MIKEYFNRRCPVDKAVIGRFGRYAVVRGTFSVAQRLDCKYGLYPLGRDNVPATDDNGIVLSFDEITQLAELLSTLISTGAIRETTPQAEFQAAAEALKAHKKAPTRLW